MVAPETILDIDAQHVSTKEVLTAFAMAFGGIFALYSYCVISDPEAASPVVPPKYAAPPAAEGLMYDIALGASEEED
jgi:hypothetical protein